MKTVARFGYIIHIYIYIYWFPKRSLQCKKFTDIDNDDGQHVMTIHNIYTWRGMMIPALY